MNVAQMLLQALKAHGAQQVWGIPGDFVLPFFREMERSAILPVYSLSHEPSVAFAADAAARWQRGLGVVVATYGAGALNTVNAVAQAYAERSPLVVIAGVPAAHERRLGLQLHHQVKSLDSQAQIFKEITCAQIRLDDPVMAPSQVNALLAKCLEESRPVLIEIPRDMAVEPCVAAEPPLQVAEPLPNLGSCLAQLQQTLSGAKRPVVIAGVEVRRYGVEAELCALVKALNVPCYTTLMGKGVAAEYGVDVVQGTYLGDAGDEQIAQLVAEADVILMVGVILSDSNFGVSSEVLANRQVVFIQHREVNFGHYSYHGLPLGAVVAELAALTPNKFWVARTLPQPALPALQGEHITPMMIATALNHCFAQFGHLPMSSDVGDCLFVSQGVTASQLVAPGYYASMGFAVPAGLALAQSSGQRPVILVGDGALQMTGMELGHCGRYQFKPIVVVLNNQGWEMIRAFAPDNQAANLGLWQFAELANVLGGRGHVAQTPAQLQSALEQAFADEQQFHLIDVRIAPGCMTPSLAHFAEKLTAKQQMPRFEAT